jgi:hypothetical protein
VAFTNVMRRNWFSGIWFSAILSPRTALLLGILGLCRPALSQELSVALLQPPVVQPAAIASGSPALPVLAVQPVTLPEAPSHRFWDKENSFLFATSAAFNTADFVITRDNLRHGGRELNPLTRVFSGSTAGLAVNFAGETAGVVALSYFFHQAGHHKLERVVSMVNISSSAAAVTFDLVRR